MNKLIFLSVFAAIFSASAAVYNVGTKLNPATVEVVSEQNRLLITCTFKAQTKFSPARNASFNRAKADQLCRQGILLYNNAKPGESIDISGITIEKQPVADGKMIKYFFAKLNNLNIKTPADITVAEQNTAKQAAAVVPEPAPAVCHRKDSVIIFSYHSENNSVKVVDSQEYTPKTFKSRKEFDDFCEEQFKRIEELAERNRQEVLENFEQAKKDILKKTEL